MSIMKSMNVTAKDTSVQGTGDAVKQKGIAVFDESSKSIQVYNTNEKTWTPKQAFNDDMMNNQFSAVVLDEHLYVFLDNKNVYRIVHSDPDATWEKIASKNFPYGSVVVLNGMAYTLDTTYLYTNCMERFVPFHNKWQVLSNKTLNVFGASLAVAEGKISVIGGINRGSRVHNEVEKFDPTTSSWSLDVPLSRVRYYSSAVTVENRIHVLGGCDATRMITSAVEYRCPRNKTWITITPMKKPRQYFSSCCVDGKIYAIGDDQSNPKTIEEFDPEKNEWNVVCQMNGKDIRPLASVALPL